MRYPFQQVRFGAPNAEQGRTFVLPIIQSILARCPVEISPEKVGMTWTFKNPRWGRSDATSQFHLVSCKDDAESLRGPRSDMVLLDEVRDIPNLQYVVEDVFGFHFVGRDDPIMVMCSTPPKTAGHAFTQLYAKEAEEEQRYFVCSVEDNPDWRQQDDKILSKLCHGKDTVAWRREALCHLVSDPEKMIVPEFLDAEKEIVVDDYPRPSHFFPWVFIDTGWVDFTAIIYAYVDWLASTLVVERTVLVRKKNTAEIADLIISNEKDLYGNVAHQVTRVGDLTPQQLDDIESIYGVMIHDAEKHDPDSCCAELRARVGKRKIRIIRDGNEGLIYQLRNGIRDDKGRFARSEEMGHCDAIAALMYGNKFVDYHANPFPSGYAIPNDVFVSRREEDPQQLKITRFPLRIRRIGC